MSHGGLTIGHQHRRATKDDFGEALTDAGMVTMSNGQRVPNPIRHLRPEDAFPVTITLDCGCEAHFPDWESFPVDDYCCRKHGIPFIEYIQAI